jgi:hypothetical protein
LYLSKSKRKRKE